MKSYGDDMKKFIDDSANIEIEKEVLVNRDRYLCKAILELYPDAILRVDFVLQDIGDGAFIKTWNYDDEVPTKEVLNPIIDRMLLATESSRVLVTKFSNKRNDVNRAEKLHRRQIKKDKPAEKPKVKPVEKPVIQPRTDLTANTSSIDNVIKLVADKILSGKFIHDECYYCFDIIDECLMHMNYCTYSGKMENMEVMKYVDNVPCKMSFDFVKIRELYLAGAEIKLSIIENRDRIIQDSTSALPNIKRQIINNPISFFDETLLKRTYKNKE